MSLLSKFNKSSVIGWSPFFRVTDLKSDIKIWVPYSTITFSAYVFRASSVGKIELTYFEISFKK